MYTYLSLHILIYTYVCILGIAYSRLGGIREAMAALSRVCVCVCVRVRVRVRVRLRVCVLGIAYSRLGDTRKAMAALSRGAGSNFLSLEGMFFRVREFLRF